MSVFFLCCCPSSRGFLTEGEKSFSFFGMGGSEIVIEVVGKFFFSFFLDFGGVFLSFGISNEWYERMIIYDGGFYYFVALCYYWW